jgi:hypothetical protein
MTERIAILDKNRKALLTLPDGALKLWMTYWMNEDEWQESFVSQTEIQTQNSQSRPTVTKWTDYLVRHGWLLDTGKTAFDKLLALGRTPSANSKQVPVYKVDDPTPKESFGVHPVKVLLQGSSSVCSSVSNSVSPCASSEFSDSNSNCAVTLSAADAAAGVRGSKDGGKPKTENLQTKTVEPKPSPKAAHANVCKDCGEPMQRGVNHFLNCQIAKGRSTLDEYLGDMPPRPKPLDEMEFEDWGCHGEPLFPKGESEEARRRVDAERQRSVQSTGKERRTTPTATALDNSPRSAAPPKRMVFIPCRGKESGCTSTIRDNLWAKCDGWCGMCPGVQTSAEKTVDTGISP